MTQIKLIKKATCRVAGCGKRCHWVARRNAWVHDQPGIDHAPIPGQPETS